jgi:transcriptional regulator with XRE-family HTH domain
MSQLDFATVLGWSPSTVSRAESGQRDTLYDIRALLEFVDALDMPRETLIPIITGGDHAHSGRRQEEVSDMSMDRRGLGGTLLGLAAAAGLSHMQVPAKADAAHVRYFSASVDQLYAQDQSVGGGALARDGLKLYIRARRMLDESAYTEATARELMSAAGEIAVCVGWLCYDADDQQMARTLYSEAHLLASQAGDSQLAIKATEKMTLQLIAETRENRHPGYARQAVTLSKRAADLARSEPCPQLHALLAAREAMAHSVVGDSAGFKLAISRAWREMGRESADELPGWLKFVNRSEIAAHEARGLWYLGDPSVAAELYHTSLDSSENLSPRNEASYRSSLATALAASGDFVGAFTEGAAVFPALDAGKIRSMRIIKRLRAVRQLAGQHASGTDFRDRYDHIVRGSSLA